MPNRNEALLQRLYFLPLAGPAARKGGQLACLFTQNQVAEVLDGRTPVYPAPFCPPWLRGCIRRANALAPVIDLDALCGPHVKGGATAPPARQLLVIRTGCPDAAVGGGQYQSLALVCRSAVETFRLTERDVAGLTGAVEPPEGFEWHGLAQGFFRLREHRVALLNLDPVAEGTFQLEKKEG